MNAENRSQFGLKALFVLMGLSALLSGMLLNGANDGPVVAAALGLGLVCSPLTALAYFMFPNHTNWILLTLTGCAALMLLAAAINLWRTL